MTKYFVDAEGVYRGGFDGVAPPSGSIEVASAPADARQIWDFGGSEWSPLPQPTGAELAATLSLPASDFWIALHVALIGKGALTPADDVQAHVLTAIDAGVSASMLSAIEGMAARILVRTAVTFYRADPKRPGLLDGVGGLLGLTGAEIDALFIDNAA